MQDNHDIYLDKEDLKISLYSERIYIDNNWTTVKDMGICTGSGTEPNPYVIKNLIIDGKGSGPCIHIRNSIVYFKVENCRLSNSGTGYSGILLVDVNNSQLINNDCNNNGIGITAARSEFNTFSGNNIYNNIEYGIHLTDSDNNVISENIVNGNEVGIYLGQSNFNVILSNTGNDNSHGIYLHLSENNTISGNVVKKNNVFGILLYSSSNNNNILENVVKGNEDGICLSASQNNTILENSVSDNHYGIWLHIFSYNNIILNNSVNGNEVGIVLWAQDPSFAAYNNNIYCNCLSSNDVNGYDAGLNNQWDNGIKGNYWSNYSGVDENNDGIGDIPYNITGPVNAQDRFPLITCPFPTINGSSLIPGYELFFLIGLLSVVIIIRIKKIKKMFV
ncbi:MAG: nitrous oxide reductase family maturation protein NosD [Promethearchaeota archaeon]